MFFELVDNIDWPQTIVFLCIATLVISSTTALVRWTLCGSNMFSGTSEMSEPAELSCFNCPYQSYSEWNPNYCSGCPHLKDL
jgi:hypothetical protein